MLLVPDREILEIEQPLVMRKFMAALTEIQEEFRGQDFVIVAGIFVPGEPTEDGQETAAVGIQRVGTYKAGHFIELHNRMSISNAHHMASMCGPSSNEGGLG